MTFRPIVSFLSLSTQKSLLKEKQPECGCKSDGLWISKRRKVGGIIIEFRGIVWRDAIHVYIRGERVNVRAIKGKERKGKKGRRACETEEDTLTAP